MFDVIIQKQKKFEIFSLKLNVTKFCCLDDTQNSRLNMRVYVYFITIANFFYEEKTAHTTRYLLYNIIFLKLH